MNKKYKIKKECYITTQTTQTRDQDKKCRLIIHVIDIIHNIHR